MSSFLPSLLMVIMGGVLLGMGFFARKKAKATESWPVAPGLILSSEVRERSRYDSGSHSSRTTYEPVVSYQYTIMGQVYTADRVSSGQKNTRRKNCYEIVAKYPAGAQVSVRYDPEKPQDAVLETIARGSTGNLILGAVLLALAVVFYLWLS